MKHLFTPLLLLSIAVAHGQQADNAKVARAFNEMPLADKLKAMKEIPAAVLKQKADSICAAHKLVLKDDKGQPVDVARAIANNKILIENGVVFYLPNGAPSPVAKKENTSLIKNN